MSPSIEIGTEPAHPVVANVPPHSMRGPVFMMINSLETGGTERQFVELARSLKDSDQAPRLGCIQKKGFFLDRGGLEGLGPLNEFPLGGSLYGWQSIRSRWRLMRCLRTNGVAVAHAFDFYANLTMIPAARLARVPVVVGSHRQLGDLLGPAQFRAQLEMFRWCDRVVCNSKEAAERLLEAGLPRHKAVVIGNGLPPAAFAETKPALERQPEIVRVGMIARMNHAYKNQSGFLRAAARVKNRFSNVQFVLVGDGLLRPQLERQAEEFGLRDVVRFLGDRRDIRAILASLDASVVPSISESLSNVMLESMAAGVPVLATAVGGNCELGADDRAILVPADDEEALAAGLERLLGDRNLRSDISNRARKFAEENFSIDRIREQYCSLYSEALAEKRGRSRVRASTAVQSSRMRVAIVGPSLRYVGGQSVQADLLVQRWKQDREVDVSFIAVDPRFPYGLRWAERIPGLRTVVREPLYAFSLFRRLKDADVAHIFSASYSSFLLAPLPALLIARLRRKKSLINYHSGECKDHLQRSYIARRALKRADTVVVPSDYLVGVFREFGIKAQAIPNVVDLSQFRFRSRDPVRPHLVCTRGFHAYYCVDVVVRAFAEVQKIFPQASLDLVGGGPQEPEVRRLVGDLGLSGVDFKGVVAHAEVATSYDGADIFINASRLDNMPVSILEAFASGLPVITTEPDGMGFMVEHERTGLLSPVGDPQALAQNVIRVLSDSFLAQTLIKNARAEMERYRWEAVREQWLEAYRAAEDLKVEK